MQKQKTLKFLTFILGLITLFSVGEISANRITADISSEDKVILTGIKNYSEKTQAGDEIKLVGKNFGKETSNLKVFLNDKQYSVEASFGREILFKLDKDMKSGELFIQRTIQLPDNSSVSLESESIFLNLDEPSISRIDAPNGLLPEENLEIEGENLGSASFFCNSNSDTALKLRKRKQDSATVELPSELQECQLIARRRGFEYITNEKLQVASPVTITGINSSRDGFQVYGKGFAAYENNLDELALIFENDKLTEAIFNDDRVVFFPKEESKILPNAGWAALEVADKSYPQFEYQISKNFPQIKSVFDLRDEGDGDTSFQTKLSGTANELSSSELFLNGKSIDFGRTSATLTGLPALSGKIWFEKDGWESEVLEYELEENLNPVIKEILVNVATRSLEIYGRNFGESREKFDVSGLDFENPDLENEDDENEVKDEKRWLRKVSPNKSIIDLPYSTGDLSVSVSNRWGKSNSVKITLPLKSDQSFFPAPSIKSIEPLEALAPGHRFAIYGEDLLGTTFADFSGQQVVAEARAFGRVELKIPDNAPLVGEVFLQDKNRNETNSISYELTAANRIEDPVLDFPISLRPNTLKLDNSWQNLFGFEFSNKLKTFTLDALEFNSDEGPLPVTELRIVNSSGSVVSGARVDLEQNDQEIWIRNLEIPASLQKSRFYIQAKVFNNPEEDQEFIFSVGNLSEQNKQQIDSSEEIKKIIVPGSSSIDRFCITLAGTNWNRCKVQRPIGDTSRRD